MDITGQVLLAIIRDGSWSSRLPQRTVRTMSKYEGRSISKLQNDIIMLIFKIW